MTPTPKPQWPDLDQKSTMVGKAFNATLTEWRVFHRNGNVPVSAAFSTLVEAEAWLAERGTHGYEFRGTYPPYATSVDACLALAREKGVELDIYVRGECNVKIMKGQNGKVFTGPNLPDLLCQALLWWKGAV